MSSPHVLPAGYRRRVGAFPRRGRLIGLGLAGVVAAGALTGCQIDNTPKSYDAGDGIVRTNFLQTCTGRLPNQSTTSTLATEPGCACAFDVFKDKVPYNGDDRARVSGYPADAPTFEDLEGRLRDDPNAYGELPQDVRDAVEACTHAGQLGPQAPGTSAPGAPAGTAAPTTG